LAKSLDPQREMVDLFADFKDRNEAERQHNGYSHIGADAEQRRFEP
jgi:hypothetical protein